MWSLELENIGVGELESDMKTKCLRPRLDKAGIFMLSPPVYESLLGQSVSLVIAPR